MLITCESILKILPIIRFELHTTETSLFVKSNLLIEVLTILKNHFSFQYKVLTCISGVDSPENLYRFKLVYELLSIQYNSRLKIKILLDELLCVSTVEKVFAGAPWWECEIWDMFGVLFSNQESKIRLLTDYGFQGHPLRKDFPLTGFIEARYHALKNRVIYENLELAQEYRTFEFLSPWENRK